MRALTSYSHPRIIRSVDYSAIDGLRFYAALLVFVTHVFGGLAIEYFHVPADQAGYSATSAWRRFLVYLADGNHGVDVFFIISGFLMARLVLKHRPFSYWRFLTHRFQRIYPAFLASLVIAAASDIFLFGWSWNAWEFAKNLAFLNAWPGAVAIAYNHVSWSLGYEFTFYLGIPSLLVIARYTTPAIAGAAALAFAVMTMPDSFLRMTALFVGAAVGSIDDGTLRKLARAIPLAPLLIAYTGCGWLKPDEPSYFFYYYPFLACAALLFVKTVWDEGGMLNRLFRSTPLRWLGTLSFSIYLYHSLVASIALHYLTPMPPSGTGAFVYVVLASALTLLVAFASYMLLERRYFSGHKSTAGRASMQPALLQKETRPRPA